MAKNKMQKFADKYFLRSNEVLAKEGLNPWVNMQVFVRNGPGKAAGIDEAVELITQNSDIQAVGGRIYAKREGSAYQPKETLMNIIAPVQEIMELETVYLGVIAAAMTRQNDKHDIDIADIQRTVEQVVELAGERPVMYFGARHWHYDMDKAISEAAFKGGAKDCSTDNGAEAFGKKGMGTIPHALENIFAYYNGMNSAVAMATDAFDRHMDKAIPRIALVDYANREIADTVATMNLMGETNGELLRTRLDGVRVDTCGENVAEGGAPDNGRKYWAGKGVTVFGAAALRKALDSIPTEKRLSIVLSSGFSNPDKVRAFNQGEAEFGMRLYDAIGAGFLDNVRCATADIVAVGETADQVDFYSGVVRQENIIHKIGRPPQANQYLERLFY